MIGHSKRIEKIIRESAFDEKKKNPALKFNPRLALTCLRTTGARSFVRLSGFIIWGSLLSASFIYSGLKLIHRDGNALQKQLEDIEIGQSTSRTDGRRGRVRRTSKVAKITIATSILGFCCCGLQLYLMFGVYSFYSKVKTPSPWPWWFFNAGFRLVEFCMACTIARYSVTQPSEPRNMNNGPGHT